MIFIVGFLILFFYPGIAVSLSIPPCRLCAVNGAQTTIQGHGLRKHCRSDLLLLFLLLLLLPLLLISSPCGRGARWCLESISVGE